MQNVLNAERAWQSCAHVRMSDSWTRLLACALFLRYAVGCFIEPSGLGNAGVVRGLATDSGIFQ